MNIREESKKVLLTGAGGAIGVHFIAHIMHNTKWDIVAIDSFRSEHKGYFDRITRVCRDHPDWKDRIRIVTHDLNAPITSRQRESIGEIDYILNLAARSDVQNSIEDPLPFMRNNSELMQNILEYARDTWNLRNGNTVPPPGKVFLQFSTDEVYGPAEKDSQGHREYAPIIPSNPYSDSKAEQEAKAISQWRSYGIPLVITNTMNNFGEMQAPSKFPAMIQRNLERGEEIKVHAAGDGQIGTRYYIHSRNVADAVLFILNFVSEHGSLKVMDPVEDYTMRLIHDPGEIDRPYRFHIAGNKQIANDELVRIIAKLMGKEPKYRLVNFHEHNPGHDLHYGLDSSLIRSLGWTPPVGFEESMKNTIEWQQRNPEWMK